MSKGTDVLRVARIHVCKDGYRDPDEYWMYGAAIFGTVYVVSNGFMVDNGEYGSTVNFCPWCGEKAIP